MILSAIENLAQVVAAHALNSVFEGILVAGFVWVLLCLLPRQNSGTRFAAWFLALIAIALLPFAGGIGVLHVGSALRGTSQPVFTISTRWAFAVLSIWAIVAFLALLRLAIGIARVERLSKTFTPIDLSQLRREIADALAEFSASHDVPVATSDQIHVPAAIGFTKPTIVVPRFALEDLAPQELGSLLLHEYAHVQRGDGWTNLLQKFLRALLCFHPAVWWIDRRLSLEREIACDDYVLAQTQNPRGYAECLLALLERNVARRGWTLAQAAIHHAREAKVRLSRILDANRPKGRGIWKPAITLVGAFSFASLLILPQTRQLVAFAPGSDRIPANVAHAVPEPLTLSPAARVVPVALHATSVSDRQPRTRRSVTPREVTRSAQSLAARRGTDGAQVGSAQVVALHEISSVAPVTETVFVISTRQAAGNSLQWSICVWRVTLVSHPRVSPAPSSKT